MNQITGIQQVENNELILLDLMDQTNRAMTANKPGFYKHCITVITFRYFSLILFASLATIAPAITYFL